MSVKSNGRNSYIRKHQNTYSRASTTPSEDSDSEDDEKERRKYISLKGGQSFLWSANKYGENWDLSHGHDEIYENVNFLTDSSIPLKNAFERHGSGRHSLKHLRNVANFKLDNIYLNNDFEYGFNPNRPRGSKANNTVLLRPMSFFSPPLEKKKDFLSKSYSDTISNRYSSDISRFSSSRTLVSFAQNDFEAQLERDVLLLRSQPCNLKFQGCKGKLNQAELAADIASVRRQRFVRRHLSFDVYSHERWKKTMSLDSGLATDSSFKSLKCRHIKKQTINEAKSEELLESSVKADNLKESKRACKSVEFLDIIASDGVDSSMSNTLQLLSPSDTIMPDSNETLTSETTPKLDPKPNISEKPVDAEMLVSSSDKEENSKSLEKTKRRAGIPHILSAFKLPNKRTFRKFIRKKMPEAPTTATPVKLSHYKDISDVIVSLKDHDADKVDAKSSPSTVKCKKLIVESISTTSHLAKVPTKVYIDKSSSSYSLPKVDEEKESFEFDLSDEHRSKSSGSISLSQSARRVKSYNDTSMLQRRMSDTALSWSDKSSVGCSPGKRFVRRLFAPVVCGISSPDRYGNFLNDSLQSLNSYDSSLTSDTDISYPRLFDFASHELVEEMTLIDKELTIRIPWEELDNCGWMAPDKFILAPNVMKTVQFFNRISMLVTTNILIEETTYKRAKIIRKAIKLACRCRYMKNYNSLKAVLSGLQCTPIFRLKDTWKQVPSRYRRLFRELSEIMSEGNNYSIYRQELSQTLRDPPCIPFLGVFLTQVAHTHAFVAVQQKYKHENAFLKDSAVTRTRNDDYIDNLNMERFNQEETGTEPLDTPLEENPVIELQANDSSNSSNVLSSSSSSSSHTRNGSNDSGVVLSLNRLSVTSDELVPSPVESGLSSPDDEIKTIGEVFPESTSSELLNQEASKNTFTFKERRSISCLQSRPQVEQRNCCRQQKAREYNKCVSVDEGDLRSRQFSDITNIINSKPIEPLNSNELYECELEFWKYQISAVQFNIMSKHYIRTYLINSPFNTEEDSYKLSLKREPPTQR